ncbi:MAG TPA: MATE family efflux transporter [Chitinophagaceae bacterium]|jgi:putative MATE family efflux protein
MSSSTQHTSKLSLFFSLVKESIRGNERDYTTGSIRQAIILLAIPMILELTLESVFAVVDIFFVGKLGSTAIQTVGLTESVISIIYTIGIGLSIGVTALVARRIGEKNPEAASHAGAQAILVSLIVTIIISIVGILYGPEILKVMKADDEVVKQGAVFTRIMLGGSLVIILLFLINGIFRGAGDAVIAMRSLWIASGINIILCPCLINGYGPFPELGLKGAAIATTIGRGIGVVYQCYYLFNTKRTIKIKRSHFNWDWPVIRSLAKISWPAVVQFFIASGSWIILSRLVAEIGGKNASSGYQIALRNVVFFILPAWGLSNAAATLVGQNLGAKQIERASQSVLLTAKYNAIFMSFVMLLFILFAGPIIGIYTRDSAVQSVGITALQIIGSGYIFYGIGMVMIQALNGAGDTRTPTWINLIGFWLFQVPLAYFMAKILNWGPTGAFISIPVAETAIAIAAWILFKKGKWKKVVV